MRRDYFTLSATGVSGEGSGLPCIRIAYDGPRTELESQLRPDGETFDEGGIDVTYRLQGASGDSKGVFAVTNRMTGEYIFELDTDADTIFGVTATAGGGEHDGNGRYRLMIETDDDTRVASYDKSTLLVYGVDGGLLRERSLIPSGVEI